MESRRFRPGDRVRNKQGRTGKIDQVEAEQQLLYVTVSWDDAEPGMVSPASTEDLMLAEYTT